MGEVTPVVETETKEPLEYIGGRKFVFAILVVVLGFVFVVLDKTTVETYFTFVELIGGIYVTSNVASKVADLLK